MTALPLTLAARELGVSSSTLRRWIRAGAPLARRGRRGRGRAALVSVEAVASWRASYAVAERPGVSVIPDFSAVPDILGDTISEILDRADGLPKQRIARMLCELWYVSAFRVMDHLREIDPATPDVSAVPLSIERLRKLATR